MKSAGKITKNKSTKILAASSRAQHVYKFQRHISNHCPPNSYEITSERGGLRRCRPFFPPLCDNYWVIISPWTSKDHLTVYRPRSTAKGEGYNQSISIFLHCTSRLRLQNATISSPLRFGELLWKISIIVRAIFCVFYRWFMLARSLLSVSMRDDVVTNHLGKGIRT